VAGQTGRDRTREQARAGAPRGPFTTATHHRPRPAQVPELWAARAYPSLKPLSAWVVDLLERCAFIANWVESGTPAVYWISGFFFPQVGRRRAGPCTAAARFSTHASAHAGLRSQGARREGEGAVAALCPGGRTEPLCRHPAPPRPALQAFLTGTLQNYARKNTFPIDTVSFGFQVRPDTPRPSRHRPARPAAPAPPACLTPPRPSRPQVMDLLPEDPAQISGGPEDGCFVRGLFMEGARWDRGAHALAESRPKELYTEMPVIWLRPQQHRKRPAPGEQAHEAAAGGSSAAHVYECPVYKTLTRAGTLSTTGAAGRGQRVRGSGTAAGGWRRPSDGSSLCPPLTSVRPPPAALLPDVRRPLDQLHPVPGAAQRAARRALDQPWRGALHGAGLLSQPRRSGQLAGRCVWWGGGLVTRHCARRENGLLHARGLLGTEGRAWLFMCKCGAAVGAAAHGCPTLQAMWAAWGVRQKGCVADTWLPRGLYGGCHTGCPSCTGFVKRKGQA
jgi:hypothetical protein